MDFDKPLPNTQHYDNDDDDINVQKPVVTSTMQSSSDHSPMSNQSGGGNLPKSNASSADGFEHIDEKIDLDFDLLGGQSGGGGGAAADDGFNTGPPPLQQHKFSNDLIDDYLNDGSGKSQGENVHKPFAASLQDQARATMDFMHSERYINEPIMQPKQPKDIPQQPLFPAPTAPPPSKQFDESKKSSLLDEIEEDYLNPYAATAATKFNEKFSSSEDLLGNIKDNVEKMVEPISTKPIIDTTLTRDIGFIQEPTPPMLPPKNIQEKPFEIPKPAAAPPKEEIIKKPAPPPSPPPPTTTSPSSPSSSSSSATTTTNVKPTHVEVIKDDKKKSATGKGQRISAEEMFYKIGLDAWFKPERLHPIVESLIYWRDVKKSGIAFGTGFLFLLALTYFSVLSVIAYTSLLIVTGTLAFRIYKLVIAAVQKTSDGHPFKEYLEMDVALPQDKVQDLTVIATAHINAFVQELRHIFLVEDFVDTIRFVVLMWFITYLGSWFNGMTLFIIAFVALFTLPKVYENNKQSIDTYLDLVKSKYVEITDKVKAAIPIGKKPESDKEK